MITKKLYLAFNLLISLWPLNGSAQTLVSDWASIKFPVAPTVINKIKVKSDSIPPVITIISPQLRDGDTLATENEKLNLIGKSTDNGLLKSLIVNSKKIIPNTSGIFSDEIALEEGYNQIRIIAMDEEMNISEKALNIRFSSGVDYTENLNINGSYYALLIAVGEYMNPELFNLENPVKDALALKNVLSKKYNFKEENIRYLDNPGMDRILEELDKLSRELTNDDNLLIFYAGHGWWDAEAGTGFWLPADADKVSRTRWIRNSTIQDFMKELKARHTLLITDACFSGSIFVSRSLNFNASTAIKKLYELPSRKAMTSGALTEVPDQSIFVRYFIDRLQNNNSRFISAEQLFTSFRTAVINNSEVLPQYGVIKNVGDEGGEFIFILR